MNEKMREAFETWCAEELSGDLRRHRLGGYEAQDVHHAWCAWQAATAATQRDAMAVAEAVAIACADVIGKFKKAAIDCGDIKSKEAANCLTSSIVASINLAAIVEAVQPSKPEPVNQQQAGVYRKFNVSRTDGRDQPGGDRYGAEYFVLDVTHDEFAKPALAAYAVACRDAYPSLADDMVRRYAIAAAGRGNSTGDHRAAHDTQTSVSELAKRCGVSAATLYRFEARHGVPLYRKPKK